MPDKSPARSLSIQRRWPAVAERAPNLAQDELPASFAAAASATRGGEASAAGPAPAPLGRAVPALAAALGVGLAAAAGEPLSAGRRNNCSTSPRALTASLVPGRHIDKEWSARNRRASRVTSFTLSGSLRASSSCSSAHSLAVREQIRIQVLAIAQPQDKPRLTGY